MFIFELGIGWSYLGFVQGSTDQSPNRQQKAFLKNRSVGNRTNNGFVSKHDELSNGIAQSIQPDSTQTTIESKRSDIQGNEKVMMPLFLFWFCDFMSC